jgi:hypothetical protein
MWHILIQSNEPYDRDDSVLMCAYQNTQKNREVCSAGDEYLAQTPWRNRRKSLLTSSVPCRRSCQCQDLFGHFNTEIIYVLKTPATVIYMYSFHVILLSHMKPWNFILVLSTKDMAIPLIEWSSSSGTQGLLQKEINHLRHPFTDFYIPVLTPGH